MGCHFLLHHSGETVINAKFRSNSKGTKRKRVTYKGTPIRLSVDFSDSLDYLVREGTGDPLQYSCLENPMDGGAW